MGYQFQVRDNYNPTESRTFVKEVPVGWLRLVMTKAQLIYVVRQTPPDNSSQESNCQTWVGAVLKKLRDSNYLLPEDCTKGIDGMVEATMEAEDEP